MAVLFTIDHEAGDFSDYDSTVTDGGDLSIAGAAAIHGAYGLQSVIDDTNLIYAVKNQTDPGTGDYRWRFYIDPNGITMATGNRFQASVLRSSLVAAQAFCFVELRDVSGSYNIRGRINEDDGTTHNIGDTNITDDTHYVEIYIEQAASAVSSDGTAELWVDGVSAGSLSGLDNYNAFGDIDGIRFGACQGVDAGTSGTFYIDTIEANDDGSEIGAFSEGGGLPRRRMPRGALSGVLRGVV